MGEQRAEMFGHVVTIDHRVMLSPEAASVEVRANVLTFKGLATSLVECEPNAHKNEEHTASALQQLIGPTETSGFVHSDGSNEILFACEALGFRQWVATPVRPQTNGVIERVNRLVLEGARTLLTRAGLDKRWLVESGATFLHR